MSRAVLFAAVCFAFLSPVLLPLGAQEPETPLATFMRTKLVHSQKLLEALATENYDVIAKQSQNISLLTLAEQWQVLQTAEYQQHSKEFRRTADAITAAAKQKNIDAVALGYVDMTMKCVNCHKYLKSRTASIDPSQLQLR